MAWTLGLALLSVALVGQITAIPFDDRLFGALLMEDGETGAEDGEPKMTIFQLPEHLKPTEYEIHVEPDLEKAEFSGQAKITVQVESATTTIVLNAKYIKVAKESVRVTRINRARPVHSQVTAVTFDIPNEQMTITLAEPMVRTGVYVVEIAYSGVLGKDMMGFYLSKYRANGKDKLMASTQFEATGARRAFPCFDQPNYKVPVTIKITRGSHLTSISNMPLKNSQRAPNSDKVIDTFMTSPNMPTYLIGFSVFEFGKISNPAGTFRVWGREDVIDKQGRYIFEKGQTILAKLSEYMDIDYYTTMPKMDLVAVPDFDAGAMENWGMTTYRDIYLFADTQRTKASRLEDVVSVVAHELSHQWFGDLVTPMKWDTVWQNEAFATFFEYAGTSWVEPTWRMEDLFVVEQVQVAFNADLKESHAMTSVTTTPDSVAATFDHIIYNKGGSVLRMLENVITPGLFKRSLQHYLKSASSPDVGGSVEPDTLWDAFDDILYENATVAAFLLGHDVETVRDVTDEWINKPGFPLVTFTRNYTTLVTTVTQHRFLLKKSDMDADKTTWTIPLTYTTASEALFEPRNNLMWFPKNEPSVEIADVGSDQWILANIMEKGFYRVNYDPTNWNLLSFQLNTKHSVIHTLNRAQLLDDAFTLSRTGLISYDIALELTKYLSKELDYIPWYSLWSHVRYLLHTYDETELGNQMKTYFIDRMEPIFTSLGLVDSTTEDNMNKIGRSSIALWFCNLGNTHCVDQTVGQFRDWIKNTEDKNIPPNIKDTVYCMGIKHGTPDEWSRLWKHYEATDLASERSAVLNALGCSQDKDTLYNYLAKILDPQSNVRSQDHYIVIRAVLGEKAGLAAGFQFLNKHIDGLLDEAKKDETSPAEDNLKSIVNLVGSGISTDDEMQIFSKILTPYNAHPLLSGTINKTMTVANDRMKFRNEHQVALQAWFNLNTPSTTPSPATTPRPTEVTSPDVPTPPPGPGQSTTPGPKPSGAASTVLTSGLLVATVLICVRNKLAAL
uniref:Aminopeptidase N n=1 Tax=Cacopsylla melanoneura TaxID=428564 RepID=A0A8D8VIK1_9HEMI